MTPKQAQLLVFIERCILEGSGVCPSYDEMAAHLGLKAKSGIHRMLTRLEERGYIRRRFATARSIVIVKSSVPTAKQLEHLVSRLADEEGPARATAALLELAEKIMPQAEAA